VNRSGFPLGFVLPPSGSTVTKTTSIWEIVLASFDFNTQRFWFVSSLEEAQANGVLPVSAAASPGLKDSGLLDAGLLIEVVSIEDERFVLGIEHAAEGLLGVARLAYVIDIGDVEIASANQIPDVAVAVEQFPTIGDLFVLVLNCFVEIIDLAIQGERLLGVFRGLFADEAESPFEAQCIGLHFGQFSIQVGTHTSTANE